MRALLSVSDKTGLIEFASGLVEQGFTLVSTGGTFANLQKAGLAVQYVSEVTGFPEILGGRVKTLHPKIHAGILAKNTPEHTTELGTLGIERFDLVCVNLYPFRETVSKNVNLDEALENIDIGGPAMIRASAKNFPNVIVVVDPKDYRSILENLNPDFETRQGFARKAFAHTSSYDAAIATYLSTRTFNHQQPLELSHTKPLRYGENPHQQAALYRFGSESGAVLDATVLSGKEMGFNNYADADAAWQLVSEYSSPACVAVKHANPCGVGLAENAQLAWEAARDADTLSVFGGVVALNRVVTLEVAMSTKGTFLEVLIAPEISADALEWFKTKKPDLRVLQAGKSAFSSLEYKQITGGFLVQNRDSRIWADLNPETVTERQPTPQEWQDLEFAFYVGKHAKSNNVVIAKNGVTVGLGAGAVSRIWAAERALGNAGEKAKGAVMTSEAFFPFDDVVRLAAKSGVTAILQPGGAKRDPEVIAACNELGISMVFTGSRHVKH
jgi:phosphoribosylaminoimidazolecarboxamide formyltransferase / IMP cyclohydrolase